MMIFYMRKWLLGGKYVCLFILLTFFLYQLLVAVSQWMEPKERYQKPLGHSVKVFYNPVTNFDQEPMGERLKLFYWLGE